MKENQKEQGENVQDDNRSMQADDGEENQCYEMNDVDECEAEACCEMFCCCC
jgi:hypothetical protein